MQLITAKSHVIHKRLATGRPHFATTGKVSLPIYARRVSTPQIPQRPSLPAHIADVIARGLSEGQWKDELPGERRLCAQLGVSRPTLRKALAQLRQAGVLRTDHGRNSKPTRKITRGKPAAESHLVLAFAPDSLKQLPPGAVFLFDELRSILTEAGLRLEVHSFRTSRREPFRAALQSRLEAERPTACLLYQAERPLHRWFYERALPCVVFGTQDSAHPLPALDLDQRATCRHAAQMLLRRGYSPARIVLAIPHRELPGHNLMRQGFHDALGSDATVFQLPDDPNLLPASLDRLYSILKPPAGLILARANHAAAALGHLAIRRGLRVPADVGLLSLSDDPFLRFIQPELTRYQRDDAALARQLAALVVRTATGATPPPRMTLVMPEFVRGETI